MPFGLLALLAAAAVGDLRVMLLPQMHKFSPFAEEQ